MIYHHLINKCSKEDVISAGLIGAGHFGTAVLTQSMELPYLKVSVIADRDLKTARMAFSRAGVQKDSIVECNSRSQALQAMEAGKYVILEDPLIMMDLPIDLVAEGTGIPEAGALHAYEAIKHGKHVAMISKEPDSAVGPVLKHLAEEAGVVYTPVDGDQHGLLMGMVEWARLLGMEVLSAGKARDAEYVYNSTDNTVTCEADGITVHETVNVRVNKEDAWALEPIPGGESAKYLKARNRIFKKLPGAGGFDYCELVIAANATGLRPEVPQLTLPIVRIPEIPEVLSPVEEQGILTKRGVIDVVTCFRHQFEPGMGGGVFMVVSCKNEYSRMIVATKGQLHNALGSTALIYRPYHLCGVETPLSIMTAGLLDVSTGSSTYKPHYDMVQTAARDLKAGEILGDDHDPSLKASIIPAGSIDNGDTPAPAHMLNGCRLKQNVKAGTLITVKMIEEPENSVLWKLRREQDKIFL